MRFRTVLFGFTLLAAGLGATACSSGSSSSSSPTTTAASGSGMGQSSASKSTTASKNIVQIAASDPSLFVHPGDGAQSSRPCDDPRRTRPLHCLRSDQRRLHGPPRLARSQHCCNPRTSPS